MAHARKQTAFFDDRCRGRCIIAQICRQQFEGDLAVEPRIPRAIDLAIRAFTDFFQQAERAPSRNVSGKESAADVATSVCQPARGPMHGRPK